jgi:hypothetical protein
MTQMPPPPGNPPGAYPGSQPPRSSSSAGLAIASMVVGILSIPCFCAWYIAIPLGVIGIILGIIAKGQADRGEAGGRGMAVAGIACGSIGVLLALIMAIIFFTAGPALQNRMMIWQKQIQQQQQRNVPSGSVTTAPSTER